MNVNEMLDLAFEQFMALIVVPATLTAHSENPAVSG